MTLVEQADPAEVGFDPDRLARIEHHFTRYVDEGLLPGWLVVVARHGRIAYVRTCGQRDLEAGLPVETDTLWRLYSMTKPITSVALMMLVEEGALELNDPVAKYLPAFADLRVWKAGSSLSPLTVPATQPLQIWHLLTHTSGLTYGFLYAHPVDAMYREAGFSWVTPPGLDLAASCDRLATLPLLFEPGAEWNYSHSTDVLGRVVEVVSGMPLDEFFRTRIFVPLGMAETTFWASPEDAGRLAALYQPRPGDQKAVLSLLDPLARLRPECLCGGAGLVGTAFDYHRFTSMLRGGGELEGTRLLGSRTMTYMRRNHLPGGADLEAFGRPLFAETPFTGVGFGLGFSVTQDPVAAKVTSSAGEFGWGGAASTLFWVDPVEDMTVSFFTQLLPSSTHPIRSQLKTLVSQALVGS